MKAFGINVREWLRAAFSVPVANAPSTAPTLRALSEGTGIGLSFSESRSIAQHLNAIMRMSINTNTLTVEHLRSGAIVEAMLAEANEMEPSLRH